jgi:hypothetical protein
MNTEEIVGAIDAEIQRLQRAKELLSVSEGGSVVGKGKRPLSTEGRARIAAAQKRRWGKVKK